MNHLSSQSQLNWQQEMMQKGTRSSSNLKNESLPSWAGPVKSTASVNLPSHQMYTNRSQASLKEGRVSFKNQTWQQREISSSTSNQIPVAFQISVSNVKNSKIISLDGPRSIEMESDLPYWYDVEKEGMPKVSLGEEVEGDQAGFNFATRADFDLGTNSNQSEKGNESSEMTLGVRDYRLHQKNSLSSSSSSSFSSSSSSSSFGNYSSSISSTRSSTPSLIHSSSTPQCHQNQIPVRISEAASLSIAYATPDFFLNAPEANDLPVPKFSRKNGRKGSKSSFKK